MLSAGAKQPLQNAEAPAEQVEQSATSSRNTSSRATLSTGKEGGRYELTPERRALLNTIRYAEGTWKDGEDKGYRIMYGGGQFQDLSRHPERVIVKRYTSAAAGAYQFLPKTWKGVAKELKLSSFEPRHQDQAALHLVERRGALKEIDRERADQKRHGEAGSRMGILPHLDRPLRLRSTGEEPSGPGELLQQQPAPAAQSARGLRRTVRPQPRGQGPHLRDQAMPRVHHLHRDSHGLR